MAQEQSFDWASEDGFNLLPSEDIFGVYRSLTMPMDEYRRCYKQAIDDKTGTFLNEKAEFSHSDADITNRDERDAFLCSLLNNAPSDYETIAITIGCLFSAFYVSGEFVGRDRDFKGVDAECKKARITSCTDYLAARNQEKPDEETKELILLALRVADAFLRPVSIYPAVINRLEGIC